MVKKLWILWTHFNNVHEVECADEARVEEAGQLQRGQVKARNLIPVQPKNTILYIKLLNKLGQDLLDRQYHISPQGFKRILWKKDQIGWH